MCKPKTWIMIGSLAAAVAGAWLLAAPARSDGPKDDKAAKGGLATKRHASAGVMTEYPTPASPEPEGKKTEPPKGGNEDKAAVRSTFEPAAPAAPAETGPASVPESDELIKAREDEKRLAAEVAHNRTALQESELRYQQAKIRLIQALEKKVKSMSQEVGTLQQELQTHQSQVHKPADGLAPPVNTTAPPTSGPPPASGPPAFPSSPVP